MGNWSYNPIYGSYNPIYNRGPPCSVDIRFYFGGLVTLLGGWGSHDLVGYVVNNHGPWLRSRCSPSKWPKWLVNGGDPNYLLARMILQVVEACFFEREEVHDDTDVLFVVAFLMDGTQL